MTETLVVVEPPSKHPEQRPPSAELDAARELVQLARGRGVALTGPNGLLIRGAEPFERHCPDQGVNERLGAVRGAQRQQHI